jgi:3-oxoacyl-[acyl-carrier-protein] synthase-1
MPRVVITGLGIVSSIGNDKEAVLQSLREGRSGLVAWPDMARAGFRSAVYAPVKDWDPSPIGRRPLQTMSRAAQLAAMAAREAIADAGLSPEQVASERTGVVVGSAFPGIGEAARAEEVVATHGGPSRAGGTGVVKIMSSGVSGNLAACFGTTGRVYSISSAFSAGLDNVGHAYDLVRFGLQDVCLAGATEEDTWRHAGVSFENAGALSTGFEERPTEACRPYDRQRAGLVLSEGAGVVVVESLEHAERRGARPWAEIVGYSCTNDGADMFRPSGEGLEAALRQALAQATEQGVRGVDYVNTHGTGTPLGDTVEVSALRKVVGEGPLVSSTKGQTGHSLGATGAQEAVYTLLMMRHGFVAPTANLREVDPECAGIRHVQERTSAALGAALTFNVGFGGTNACVVLRRIGD